MSDMKKLELLRANDMGGHIPPILQVEISEQVGELGSLDQHRCTYADQAEQLVDALFASLPGGTVDALLVEMMRRKVSLFSVPLGS